MVGGEEYRATAEEAWTWVLSQVRGDDGPWLPEAVSDDDPQTSPAWDRDGLYGGIAGLAPVLAEIALSRPLAEFEKALSDGVVRRLSAEAAVRTEPSYFDGLAGTATALRLLSPGEESVPLHRLHELRTPAGWKTTLEFEPGSDAPLTDLVMGSAGVVLAAVWAGGPDAAAIATTGGEALLDAADKTNAGLDWGMVPGWPSRGPNYSHGTAGISAALAVAGTALGRSDFIDAAVLGAQHLLSVASMDDGGFIVPHTIPPSRREVEPLTYSWCHGPTGTSHLFAALSHAGIPEVDGIAVDDLRQRCLHSTLTSGVPERLRPGFWDNDGRCCGTAGVGDVLLDAAQDCADDVRAGTLFAAARTMGDALVERAIRDVDGTRWRFIEYRQEQPLLSPGTGWMQGAAGIAAFLFRLSRVVEQGLTAQVVDRPDQWWAVPAQLRLSGAAELLGSAHAPGVGDQL